MTASRYRRALIVIAVLGIALLALRAALPGWVKSTLNERLADMGDYRGHISTIDIDLWRGAYQLENLKVVKTTGEIPVPFFRADVVDLSISWPALLNGAVVARVTLNGTEINFVDDPDQEGQAGGGTDWREALQRLVPIRINALTIRNGGIHFRNFDSNPPVDLRISDIHGTIKDLNNLDRSRGAQPAAMALEGRLMEHSQVSLTGNLDPLGDFRDFDFALKIDGIDLRRLNDLAKAYGNFDFQKGHGHFIMELAANDGQLSGYAKPLLDGVEIVDLEEDLNEGALSAIWEGLVDAMGEVFSNQRKDRIASQIEIRGQLDRDNVSAWQAFISIVHNAFVDAYEAEFGRES